MLIDVLNNELKKAFGTLPEEIFHYTGATGLLGLLKSNKFWATRVDYLNDPVEKLHGRKIVVEVAREQSKEESEKEIADLFYHLALNLENDIVIDSNEYYLSSFSENGDDLVQWRTYGHDGHGYAVGVGVGRNEMNSNYLIPVLYNQDSQYEIAKSFMLKASEYLNEDPGNIGHINSAYHQLAQAIKVLIISMKQKSYEHEKEWRVVFSPHQNKIHESVQFREGKNQAIIPYVQMSPVGESSELQKIPISSIRLGPQRNSELEAIRMLLYANGHPRNTKVVPSNILYRS